MPKNIPLMEPLGAVQLPPLNSIRHQVQDLLNLELFQSACTVAQLLHSAYAKKNDVEVVTDLTMYGDALFGVEEYHRALQKYKLALYKNQLTNFPSSDKGRSVTKRKQNPSVASGNKKWEKKRPKEDVGAEEKFEPLFPLEESLDENREMDQTFVGTTYEQRDVNLHVKVAKCYRKLGDDRQERDELSAVVSFVVPPHHLSLTLSRICFPFPKPMLVCLFTL